MNQHEARLSLIELIRDSILELSDDGTEQTDEFVEGINHMAETILEIIDLEIISVDGDTATVTVWLRPEE